MNKIRSIFVLVGIFAFFLHLASCKKDDDTLEKLKAKEARLLKDYLKENNITVSPTSSGLYFIDLEEGSGDYPVSGDRVVVGYTGYLLDGRVFDTTEGKHSFKFLVDDGGIIAGMNEGIKMIRKGGKGRLIIPSDLAYKGNSVGIIPPYSTLIMDIELKNIGY